MTLEMIRSMLAWCTVIDLGVLVAWFLLFTLAHDLMYRIHGKWFRMEEKTFDAVHYSGMALFKLGILIFNLVPYIVLRIIG
ncbi:MAG: hypothetical protein VB050_14510 [Geobacteraceae bacterium]|nr:hypothetical protein [Geobacteraceae bacterium]